MVGATDGTVNSMWTTVGAEDGMKVCVSLGLVLCDGGRDGAEDGSRDVVREGITDGRGVSHGMNEGKSV